MAYSGNPATSAKDEVWFLLQDTADPPQLSEEEVEYLLDNYGGSVYSAAARGAEILYSRYSGSSSRTAVEKQVGPLRLKYSEASELYKGLAASLWRQAGRYNGRTPYAGGISRTDKAANVSNSDRVKPFFSRGMQHYPMGTPLNATEEDLRPPQDEVV